MRQPSNSTTVPFLEALFKATRVVTTPSVSVPRHRASARHARIAAYTESFATATHTDQSNTVSALDKAKSVLGPQAEPFLDNLVQSLSLVKPLAVATVNALHDQMHLASRNIARHCTH